MKVSPADRRAHLKNSTRELHERLDALASTLDLAHRADYCRFLLASAGPLLGLELTLEESGVEAAIPRWAERRRRFKLARDLYALGLSAKPVAARRGLSVSEIFGIVYVLEGSRLGTEVLRRRVARTTDETIRAARSFIDANDATLWPSFLRVLQDASTLLDAVATAEAACYAFELFNESFAIHCTPAAARAYGYANALAVG